jgi:hypothetical protein
VTSPGSARDTALRALISGAAVAALLVTLLFLWHARQVLLIVFAGILFGIFLRRLATGADEPLVRAHAAWALGW